MFEMKDKKGNEYDAWCVTYKSCKIAYTTRIRRSESIFEFIRAPSRGRGWKHFYRQGYRCVKVRLVEVEKGVRT